MSRNKRQNWQPWISDFRKCYKNGNEKYYITIPGSLFESEAFKDLSGNAVLLLLLCYVQARGKPDFELTQSTYQKRGLAKSTVLRNFDELEKHGFIKCIECNRQRYKANKYHFIEDWKIDPENIK
jgi:hypothetical protein